MKGEVETQFSLSGLLLHTQPLHSSEQHTRAHLEFSSHFVYVVRDCKHFSNAQYAGNSHSFKTWVCMYQSHKTCRRLAGFCICSLLELVCLLRGFIRRWFGGFLDSCSSVKPRQQLINMYNITQKAITTRTIKMMVMPVADIIITFFCPKKSIWLQDIPTSDFLIPSFNPGILNPRLFNHEHLSPRLQWG